MDLGKFNPNDFKRHETAFINLLAQAYGVQGKNLKYIVLDVIIPAEFVDEMPNGACISYPLQVRLTARTKGHFTIC
jgi:hypothetical protein